METGTKIIPMRRREIVRRRVKLSAGPRPDIQSVLDLLYDIDPALIERSPSKGEAAAPAVDVAKDPPRAELPTPPAPINATPSLPRPLPDARARTLTSLVFPEGAACSISITLPRLAMTCCLN